MTINEKMNQSFKHWLGIGVPLFVLIMIAAVIMVHIALRAPWNKILFPAVYFLTIQIVFFAAMYFARKYGKPRNRMGPAILLFGLYGLAMGLLAMYYFAQWGVISSMDLHNNYLEFTIVILTAAAVTTLLPWKR